MMTVIPFSLPTMILAVGASRSEKSEFIKKLIKYSNEMFDPAPSHIIYCYSVWSDDFQELEDKVEFRTDIPSKEELLDYWQRNKNETLLVMDELMSSIDNGPSG